MFESTHKWLHIHSKLTLLSYFLLQSIFTSCHGWDRVQNTLWGVKILGLLQKQLLPCLIISHIRLLPTTLNNLFTRCQIPSVPGKPLEHQEEVVSIPAVLLLIDTNLISLQNPWTSSGFRLYASLGSSESFPTSKIFPSIMNIFHLLSSPLLSLQDHWFFLGMLLFCLFFFS